MQPQHREVHVENNEYETEQQCLAKQIKCVVLLINNHTLAFCEVQKCAHALKLFQRNTYALPSFSNALHLIAHAGLVPRLVRALPTHKPRNEAMHMHDRKVRATPTN